MERCTRCAVESLIIEYAACCDSVDLIGLERLFTHDAIFEVATADGNLELWDGAEIILERLGDALTGAQQIHFMSNIRILDEDANGISTESRIVLIGTPDNEAPELRLTGIYRDRIVEHDGVLRFAERRVVVR